MKHKAIAAFTRALGLLAVMAALPAYAVGQTTSASSPATGRAKYLLSPDWSATRQVEMVRKTQVESVRQFQLAPTAKPHSQQIALSTIIDFSFKVRQSDNGLTIMEGPVKRVRTYDDARFGGDEKKPKIDTDKPDAEIKQFSYEEILAVMAGLKFKLTVDERYSLLAIEGSQEYARLWVKRVLGRDDADSVLSARERLDERFPRLVLEAFSYLPDKPQAVGDSWKIERGLKNLELEQGMDSTVIAECHEEVECKLKEIQRQDGREIAIIEITGHWLSFENGRRGGLPQTKFPRKGEMKFDLSSRRVLSYQAITDGLADVYTTLIMSSMPNPARPIGTNRVKYIVSMDFTYGAGATSGATSQP